MNPAIRTRQLGLATGTLAVVVLLDQSAKWWAWRHLVTARINAGGDNLVSAQVSEWFRSPTQGAALDLLNSAILVLAVALLLRRVRSVPVLLSGCAMLAGWSSNLLDRLGLHFITAPGSVRGAVDFMHLGQHYYNLADFVIIGSTPLFVLAVLGHTVTRWRRRGDARPAPIALLQSLYLRIPAYGGALGLGFAASFGAATYGGLTAPAAVLASASTHALSAH
jgi:lipoprotein signal peptidase